MLTKKLDVVGTKVAEVPGLVAHGQKQPFVSALESWIRQCGLQVEDVLRGGDIDLFIDPAEFGKEILFLLCRKIRKSQGHGTEATLITPHARPGAQG